MTMVMHDEHTLDRASHAKVLIVVLEALQTSRDRWIFFRLRLFGTEGHECQNVVEIWFRNTPESKVGERIAKRDETTYLK